MAHKNFKLNNEMLKKGLGALRDLVMDNMACTREQRYLIICWVISSLLRHRIPCKAIMKFSGGNATGKTTAANLLSKLFGLHDQEELCHITAASAYTFSDYEPLVIFDGLEENDRNKSLKMFLLLCATGGSLEHPSCDSDSPTAQENPRCLVLITAIEPLEEPELLKRTLDIEFSKAYRTEDFVESRVLREIEDSSESIIFSMVSFVQQGILPDLESGIKRNLNLLKGLYKGHSKARLNEHLALLMLILEKLLPHMPLKGDDDFTNNPAEIWAEWLRYQDRQTQKVEE